MELLKNAPGTLRFPEAGGDPVEFAEKPKVTIVRDSDGKEVLKAKEATEAKEDEQPYWTVEVESQPEPDLLTATWTAKVGEVTASYETRAEVVGGLVVSLAAIEEHLGEAATTPALEAARETALREIEGACGLAFRPRYDTETLDGSGTRQLILDHRSIIEVLAVEVDETAMSKAELEALTITGTDALVSESVWPAGRANVKVKFVHGKASYPEAVGPVRDYAAYLLTQQPTDWQGRATSFTNEIGTTYSLITPGIRGASFPLPSVNAFVQRHGTALVG